MQAKATVILKNDDTPVNILKSDRVELLTWLIRHDAEIKAFTVETVSAEDIRQGRVP